MDDGLQLNSYWFAVIAIYLEDGPSAEIWVEGQEKTGGIPLPTVNMFVHRL